MNEDNAINIGKTKIDGIERYVPDYTQSIPSQVILSKQVLSKIPTEFQYVDSSIFMIEVKIQSSWTFELRTREGINVPKWIVAGFQQRNRQDRQNLNNDNFYRPPVTYALRIIGTEKYPDSGIFLNYDDDVCSQGY